jgi:hypothetical protein
MNETAGESDNDRQGVHDDVDARDFYPLLADLAPEDWEDPSVCGLTSSS